MYSIRYEYRRGFPPVFQPLDPTLAHADTYRDALRHIRRVCGRTRAVNTEKIDDPRVIAVRQNVQYVATILDAGRED